MESKSLRKQLRERSGAIHLARISLETIYTEDTKKILSQFPFVEGEWRHPLEHFYDRTIFFLEESEKVLNKVISSLPKERKTKIVRFIEPKAPKEKSLSEQATKKGKKGARSAVPDPGTKKRNRKPKNETGEAGAVDKLSGGSVQSEVQRIRRPRSDKGKKRG